jgi:hypothetical protein
MRKIWQSAMLEATELRTCDEYPAGEYHTQAHASQTAERELHRFR